jgi:hypothetical protein
MVKRKPQKVSVFFELKGEQAERFLKYKAESFLRSTAEAARKLALERLSQLEPKQEVRPDTA